MHGNRNSEVEDSEEALAPAREDARWQARVLSLLLAEIPHPLSEKEIARELLDEEPDFADEDGIKRAIQDLIRVGLAQRAETLISPSRAARHMSKLLSD
ncbi:MAG TPA: hypothetical protein VFY04_02655 [Solirubrobacterales bacterium]|nr:hypothetical protein [Solirubrobacterales bacterium]